MKKIKIAQVTGRWVGGGIEKVVISYIRNLDKDKFIVDLICESESSNIPYKEIERYGGKVYIVPAYKDTSKYIKELTNIFKNNNYDIVHSHTNALSYLSLKAAKKAKVPVRIAHSHLSSIKLEDNRLLKNIYRPLLKSNATHYFACNEASARFLFGNKAYENGEVTIINNAIDVDKFKFNQSVRAKKRKELNISDDKLVIGHIGRFVNQKNHEYILKVFKEIHDNNPNSVLLLAGQGPLMKTIREKAYSMNIYDDIKFLGQIKRPNELYQVMDAFILPSFYEGHPLTLVEAESSGLYSVISSSMKEDISLLDSTTILDLNISPKIWGFTILHGINSYSRKDTSKIVKEKGYDIKDVIKVLEKKYLEITKI